MSEALLAILSLMQIAQAPSALEVRDGKAAVLARYGAAELTVLTSGFNGDGLNAVFAGQRWSGHDGARERRHELPSRNVVVMFPD